MKDPKKLKVFIIGCSNMGARIADYLCYLGSMVTMVDINKESFKKLSHVFSGFLHEGDGTNIDLLRQVGILNYDLVLVSTDDDNTNSFIAQICKSVLNIKQVIVRMDFSDCDNILNKQGINIIHPSDLSLDAFLSIQGFKED